MVQGPAKPQGTSREYSRPYRPTALKVGHGLARALRLDGMPSLDPDRLIARARRAEGLNDLGEPDLEPLRVLVRSIEAEAQLHPLGRVATAGRLIQTLRNRLRAVAEFERDPTILTRPLPSPIVISGLQRTGTTLLHRLLASDPRLRALRSWEALNPAALRGAPRGDKDPRRVQAARAEAGLKWLSPDFFAVHPVEASAPEEEVLLLDHSFLSTVPEATLRVPTYSAWLEQQDQTQAYTMLRRLLQLLTSQEGPDRWVLKTPHHLEWLDTLWNVFPDATVVMTHRDPVVTVGSFCSMVAHGRGVMSDVVDPKEIGRDWLEKVGRMMDRALASRDARGDRGVIDVQYADLMRDPLGEIARIRAAASLEPDAAADAAVAAALASMPKDRHGSHSYDLADFGLTSTMVADRFAAYRERFTPKR